jgi:hypothetical protein
VHDVGRSRQSWLRNELVVILKMIDHGAGIGDMRWNRFLAILLGLITVLATAGITNMLLPGDDVPQETSGDTEPTAAAPPSPDRSTSQRSSASLKQCGPS